MASLEETRTEEEKPNKIGNRPRPCLPRSRTRMGGWAVAQSPILLTTITLERLRKRGYEALLSYYENLLRILMNRPDTCRRDGVRGALRQLITGGAVYSIIGRFLLLLFFNYCNNFNVYINRIHRSWIV